VKHWDIAALDVEPRAPQVISTTGESRAIVLELPEGESLHEHQVHERAWLVVVRGEVEVSSGGDTSDARPGVLFEFDPAERHEVVARSASRLLLLLAPWPGDGHPNLTSRERHA
jgi:quercetin dioxygenase-like cupin family protein